MGQKELELCNALEEWRLGKVVEEYGKACAMDYGPGAVLPTALLDQIVDCAHHLKLRTIDDLRKETRWSSTALYGVEVLAVVNKFIPQPQSVVTLTRAPLMARPVSQPQPHPNVQHHNAGLASSASSSGVTKKCSACGLPGHNSKSCFRRLSHSRY